MALYLEKQAKNVMEGRTEDGKEDGGEWAASKMWRAMEDGAAKKANGLPCLMCGTNRTDLHLHSLATGMEIAEMVCCEVPEGWASVEGGAA